MTAESEARTNDEHDNNDERSLVAHNQTTLNNNSQDGNQIVINVRQGFKLTTSRLLLLLDSTLRMC